MDCPEARSGAGAGESALCRPTRRAWLAALALGLLSSPAAARGPAPPKRDTGRPTVVLDRLDLPEGLGRAYGNQLRKVLTREVRRVEWGAGRNNRIEYRFALTELDVSVVDDVLRVRASAVGRLPGGRKAKSRLTFGGDPSRRAALVSRVLEIVARGVITRLAELERVRRGDLNPV